MRKIAGSDNKSGLRGAVKRRAKRTKRQRDWYPQQMLFLGRMKSVCGDYELAESNNVLIIYRRCRRHHWMSRRKKREKWKIQISAASFPILWDSYSPSRLLSAQTNTLEELINGHHCHSKENLFSLHHSASLSLIQTEFHLKQDFEIWLYFHSFCWVHDNDGIYSQWKHFFHSPLALRSIFLCLHSK